MLHNGRGFMLYNNGRDFMSYNNGRGLCCTMVGILCRTMVGVYVVQQW